MVFNINKYSASVMVIFLICFFLPGCSQAGGVEKLNESKGTAIIEIYGDGNTDSTALINFLKGISISDSAKSSIKTFYAARKYKYAWFNEEGLTEAAVNFYNQVSEYISDFADLSLSSIKLDSLFFLAQGDGKLFIADKTATQELEFLLTTTFFIYAKKVYGGTAKDIHSLEWFIPRDKKNYQRFLDSMISPVHPGEYKEPLNEYYVRLKNKLKEYRNIEKRGGFPVLSDFTGTLSLGDNDSALINVKRHLFLTNDLAVDDHSSLFTDSLVSAVKRFQRRTGLMQDGKLTKLTVSELKIPISFRIKQMMINMERLRWVPAEIEQDYLLVNIPEYRLHIFENHNQVWETNIVVGKSATQTTIFKGNISQIVLNPYWNIPPGIIRKEILPDLKRNSRYLSDHNMQVLSGERVINAAAVNWKAFGNSVPYTIRQKPGINNALGKMKFLFPNSYNIYLHDTPSKELLDKSLRAFSHGCIRVKDPKRLAVYLLRKDSLWTEISIDRILQTDQETRINLAFRIPVYITYFTAWVDNTGQLNFRNDIYGLDEKLSKEIFTIKD